MRIPKGWVRVLSREIIENLLSKEQIEFKAPREQVVNLLEELVIEELVIEDSLNEEVREMLKKYESEIEKGQLDYHRVFAMTKQKLVKERNIIL